MLSKLKSQFYDLIKHLGYNITDNGEYKQNFPWLMLRTNGGNRINNFDLRIENITLVLDIFSTYQGEKEILDIVENIGNHLNELKKNNLDIVYLEQKNIKIIDDKTTGPIKKHGVITYNFLLTSGLEDFEEDEEDA